MLPAVASWRLMFNYNASSGGTDIIAMILKKYTNISEIGKALFVSDSVIALASCFFFGIQTGMFSILGLFLKLLWWIPSSRASTVQVLLHCHLKAPGNL